MAHVIGPSAAQLLADWRHAERALDADDGRDRESLEATVADAARAFQDRVAELLHDPHDEDGPITPSAPRPAEDGLEG